MLSKLICTNPSHTIGMDELKNNVSYTHCINSDEDLQPGQVASAQIVFTTTYSGLTEASVIEFWTKQDNNPANVDNGWRRIGIFIIDEIRKNRTDFTITAYDNIIKFDREVSIFLRNTSATTVWELFVALCAECKVTRYNTGFSINGNMTINPKELVKDGISGRTILHYIAEAIGGYAFARDDGKIHLDVFGNSNNIPTASVSTGDYENLDIAELPCPQIDGVRVATHEGVCEGYAQGTGSPSSEIAIAYNPLFFSKSLSEAQGPVDRLYSELHNIGSYYACRFHLFQDSVMNNGVQRVINAGDLISVDGKPVIVFTKSLNDNGCDITCTGGIERLPQVITISQQIDQQNAQLSALDLSNITGREVIDLSSQLIYVNDIFSPSFYYDESPDNISLMNLLNAILTGSAHRTGAYEYTTTLSALNGINYPAGYQRSYNTGIAVSDYSYSPASPDYVTIDDSGSTYVISGIEYGTETISFTNRSTHNTDYRITCEVWDAIVVTGNTIYIDFPPHTSYEPPEAGEPGCTVKVTVPPYGVVANTTNTDINNDKVSIRFCEGGDNVYGYQAIEFIPRVNTSEQPTYGAYLIDISDGQHPEDIIKSYIIKTI